MHTSQHFRAAVLAAASLLAGAAAAAGTPVIYPAKEQSARQQDQDKYACHDWARNESGFDPTAQPAPLPELAAASAPAAGKPAPTATDKLAGAMTGAAGGAAIAELAHRDAGRGAAMGLLGSNVLARVKQGKSGESSAQQQQQRAQQQAALHEHARQQRAGYDRAFAACLEGRGYVVK